MDQPIITLLEKFTAGSLTSAEQNELATRIRALDDIAFRELAQQYEGLVSRAEYYPAPDMELYDSVRTRIHTIEADIRPTVSIWRRYAVAAAVLLLLAAGAWFWQQRTPASQLVNTAVASIAPGTHKAMLTLADGSTIPLDSAGRRQLQQGATAIRQQGGQLLYDVQGSNHTLSYNTLTTPRGGQFQVQLPDGTGVWLNAASSIRYPTEFTGKERVVEITGEVYFEVAKNAAKPFRVKANNTDIEVLGTRFNVNAYADEPTLNTTLLDGAVRINDMVLKPGQQAQFNGTTVSVQPANIEKVMAWKNGLFNFEDMGLRDIMRQIARWYDIEVVFEKDVNNIQFWGKMSRNVPLSDVLEGLKDADVHFRTEGKKLIVTP